MTEAKSGKKAMTQTQQQSAQTILTQNQQTKNVCADLFCIVLYCIVMKRICEECKKKIEKNSQKTHKKHTQRIL